MMPTVSPSAVETAALLANGIQELTIEPEATNLPVPAEALDELLHYILRTLRPGCEVFFKDRRICLTIRYLQFFEANGSTAVRLFYDERLPSTSFNFLEETVWASAILRSKNCGGDRYACIQGLLHVFGLQVDRLLNFPRRHYVSAILESICNRCKLFLTLAKSVQDVIASYEVTKIQLQPIKSDVLREDEVHLDFWIVFSMYHAMATSTEMWSLLSTVMP